MEDQRAILVISMGNPSIILASQGMKEVDTLFAIQGERAGFDTRARISRFPP
jgi:hypothetical protein